MVKRKYIYYDVEYYVPGRKKSITGSTRPISAFLAIVHEENPALSISQLRELLLDCTRYLINPDAIAVLDTHIEAGYGDYVPQWKYV